MSWRRTFASVLAVSAVGVMTAAPVHAGPVASSPTPPVDVRPDLVESTTTSTSVETAADAMSAGDWHAAGITGAGVRIGVIDFFDVELFWDEATLGPRPIAGVTARCFDNGGDCTDTFFDGLDEGSEAHGVAVVEAIRSVAPDAEVFLGQATTVADYTALVDWFASRGVRIVNRSLGSRYDGPGDGRGSLDDVAAVAVAKGMTWINSAGNNALGRYYRHPVRLVGNDVAFGDTGEQTFLRAKGCVSLAGMRWANDWDRRASDRTDYDLLVRDSPTGDPASGTVVGRSERRQRAGASPLEHIAGELCPSPGNSLYLEVRWLGGDVTGDVLEILDYRDGFAEHTQSASSAAVAIVDAKLAGVVAVGAVDAAGQVADYSSRGPTNDGRVAPTISAPTGFRSSVYAGSFAGTSAAAAAVTGAAALLLDADLAGDASSLGDLLRNIATDRGQPGPDNDHGFGELVLPAPPSLAVDSTPSRYVPLAAPIRFLDTRPQSAVGPTDLLGATWAGEIRRLPVAGLGGVPASATSVAVNLVTVSPDRRSYVQALPFWQSTLGGYSNLNTDGAAQNRANFAIVPIADDGTIALYSTASGHLVVDVLGWFEPVGGQVTDGRFVELPRAERLLDTRTTGGPVATGSTVAVPNPVGVPAGEVAALVVTVTAVRPSAVGWLQAFPAERTDVVGRTSTVNTSPGSTAASTAIVPIGQAGLAVHADFGPGGSGHVLVDVIGYVTSAAAEPSDRGRYVPVTPGRALDSRAAGGPLADGQTVVVDAGIVGVPDDASAVVWNLTVVGAARRGFAAGWAAGAPRPATSVLNWSVPGEVRAAAAVTAVSAGAAQFRVDDEGSPAAGALGHLLADVFGYFT